MHVAYGGLRGRPNYSMMLTTKAKLILPKAFCQFSQSCYSTATSAVGSAASRFKAFPNVKETGFESQWRQLSEAERDVVEKEYQEIGKGDWHKLTFDQMRALYTIAYDAPELKDPNQGRKVFWGTVALLGVSGGLFALARSFAKPAPKTMTPEYQEATKQYLLEQNANPIRGLSSQKARAADDE